MSTTDGEQPGRRLRFPGIAALPSRVTKATLATTVLIVVGGVIAPSTVSLSAIMSMLPFFAARLPRDCAVCALNSCAHSDCPRVFACCGVFFEVPMNVRVRVQRSG